MLFRRRKPETFWRKVRTWLWPRRSWRRSLSYLKKRVLRLNATPHAIAAGFAAGVFATFTPFLGFHFILALVLSYFVAGNMGAAALGTAVGNPFTFPFIWGATYEVGRFVLYSDPPDGPVSLGVGHALLHMNLAAMWQPLLKPMLVGALPLGSAAALASYWLVHWASRSFQEHRAHRILAARERERRMIRRSAGGKVGELP